MDEIKDVDGPLDDFVDEEIDCLEASIDEENKMAWIVLPLSAKS